jgi:hypothetical protein
MIKTKLLGDEEHIRKYFCYENRNFSLTVGEN